nr:PREDICTED: uncharacterized protein LOC102690527 isoform X1 [Lepisosteus oculatus]
MTSYKPAHTLCKAKARHLCFLVLLCFQLAVGDVPGPCRHSVTGDHLKKVNSLIANQMQNGCAITYTFTEQGSLSDTCYVKAAFPKILELLRDHFSYGKSSDNYQYVQAVKRLVQEIYTQKCIQEIDLEREYDPAKFAKTYTGSPKEALEKVRKVISLYKSLMTKNNKPVNWNCEDQYAEDILETTTSVNKPTGPVVCQCSCPTAGYGASEGASLAANSLWKGLPKLTASQPPIQPYEQSNPPQRISSTGGRHLPNSGPAMLEKHQGSRNTISVTSPDGKKQKKTTTLWDYFAFTVSAFPKPKDSSSFLTSGYSTVPTSSNKEDTQKTITTYPFINSDPLSLIPSTPEYLDHSHISSKPPESMPLTVPSVGSIVIEGKRPSETTFDTKELTESYIPNLDGTARLNTEKNTDYAHLGKDNIINSSPSLEDSMNHPTTSLPSQDTLVGDTPNGPEESTAIALIAKRSVDPRMEGSFYNSETDTQINRAWASGTLNDPEEKEVLERILGNFRKGSPVPQTVSYNGYQPTQSTSRQTWQEKVIPTWMQTEERSPRLSAAFKGQQRTPLSSTISPSNTPQSQQINSKISNEEKVIPGHDSSTWDHIDKSLASDPTAQDSGKESQSGTSEDSNNSYKPAFIVVAVCGGLLLITTLYCFIQKKKLEALKHGSQHHEERVDNCSSRIAMEESELLDNSDSTL